MGEAVWKVLGTGAAIGAGILAKKLATTAWKLGTGNEPPVNPEDPETFFLYEQYTDAQAYEDHKNTPHFQENVFGYILEYLAERSVKTYETIDA